MKIVDNRLITNNKQLAGQIYEILSICYSVSPWSIEQIVGDLEIPESLYFLAYSDENEFVGFMATQTVLDEREITNIAVRPIFRRQGVAEGLLNQLLGFQGVLFLEVRAGNQPAQQLYKKFGFEEFNRRRLYYSNPVEDALLLKKEQI